MEHGLARFTGAAQLDAAFLWEAIRTVAARTATIKFQGNEYETAPELAGQAVTIRYSPFDLTLWGSITRSGVTCGVFRAEIIPE